MTDKISFKFESPVTCFLHPCDCSEKKVIDLASTGSAAVGHAGGDHHGDHVKEIDAAPSPTPPLALN